MGDRLDAKLQESRQSRRNLLLAGTSLLAAAGLQSAAPVTAALAQPAAPTAGTSQPNIVLILADNLGYGELGSYGGGITRGAPTPRLDALANEGTRLTNFNVEPSCTPSRSALMTSRHPIGSGTYTVPIDGRPYGLVQWEITIAKLLSKHGYATAHYGKWHLGDSEGRYPNDQGFDEWYGIPNSSDESWWPQQNDFDPAFAHLEHLMEGRKGEKTRVLGVYDAEACRNIDSDVTNRTIEFMQRNVKAGKPFFAYVPITQPHMPTEVSKAFARKRATVHSPICWPKWTSTLGGSWTRCWN